MTERPIQDQPDRADEAILPEERQDWGSGGYAAGREVDTAEAPSWGPNGFAGTLPGEVAEVGGLTDEELESNEVVTGQPGDTDDPGTHPASVIAGR